MRKNIDSQKIAFQMTAIASGASVTSGDPIVYVTLDGASQATGLGTAVHKGNGQWIYTPIQAETNGNHVAYTMVLSGAISQTINVYPVAYDPGDATRLGLAALPNSAPASNGGLATVDSHNRIAGVQGTLNTLDALDEVESGRVANGLAQTLAAISSLHDVSAHQIAASVWSELHGSYVTPGTFGYLLSAVAGLLNSGNSNGNLSGNCEPSGDFVTDLIAARDNIARQLVEITSSPKPSYSIDGQQVEWNTHFRNLSVELERLQKAIQATSPFEMHTWGETL